jgi:hypothetical protein
MVEVLLAAAAVAFDVFLPTIVILLLATISLGLRRSGPGSLGFHRVRLPGRMIITVSGRTALRILLGVGVSSALFALAHTEQGMIGVVVTFLDALYFSALRWRFRTLWAAVLAHGFNNTIGLVTFFFVGPIYGLW